MSQSANRVLETFLKSTHGEGSRGGHIIGHTKGGRAIYGAAHAHFDKYHTVPSGMQPKDVDSYVADEHLSSTKRSLPQAVVPLSDGHTARRTIHGLFHDASYDDGAWTGSTSVDSAKWAVHAPDGSKTDHQLDASFLDHPQVKDIEQAHDEDFIDESKMTDEEMNHAYGHLTHDPRPMTLEQQADALRLKGSGVGYTGSLEDFYNS